MGTWHFEQDSVRPWKLIRVRMILKVCCLCRAWALSTLAGLWQQAVGAWCLHPGPARFLWKCCRNLRLGASRCSPLLLTLAMPRTLQQFCNGLTSTCLPCSTMHTLQGYQVLPCLTAWAMQTSGKLQSRRWGKSSVLFTVFPNPSF